MAIVVRRVVSGIGSSLQIRPRRTSRAACVSGGAANISSCSEFNKRCASLGSCVSWAPSGVPDGNGGGERTRVMLQAAGADVLLVDDASARQLRDVLADRPVPIVAPLSEAVPDAAGLGARVLTAAGVARANSPAAPARPAPEDIAYLLFT